MDPAYSDMPAASIGRSPRSDAGHPVSDQADISGQPLNLPTNPASMEAGLRHLGGSDIDTSDSRWGSSTFDSLGDCIFRKRACSFPCKSQSGQSSPAKRSAMQNARRSEVHVQNKRRYPTRESGMRISNIALCGALRVSPSLLIGTCIKIHPHNRTVQPPPQPRLVASLQLVECLGEKTWAERDADGA
jgi:hypothetical protein